MTLSTVATEVRPTRSGTPLLAVEGLTCRFGQVVANDSVTFLVQHAEIHAVLGENGAGKSTLMKLVYGVYHPDEGQMHFEGEKVCIDSPAIARRLGIGMVFQDLRLIPAFTVAENIALGLPLKGPRLDRGKVSRQIVEAAERYGLAAEPDALVRTLSIGERQRVEILKALMAGAKLLILDEPTSVLAPQEVDTLFVGLDKLRSQGLSVIIITHKLHEARAICDRVTVLRGGRVILSAVDPAPMSDGELVDAMVGRSVPALPAERPATPPDAATALELKGVSVKGDRGQLALTDVTLSVRKGEILGIAGVSGNGQRELYEVALGLRPAVTGSVKIGSTEVSGPVAAIEAGAVGVPEDPVADAVVPGLSVAEHMALANLKSFRKGLGIDWKSVRDSLGSLEEKAQLRMQGAERTLADLSGGNIQRVMLTRALATPGPFVAAAYPSRGLDVATTRRTQELLLEQRAAGAGVLFISEDLDELMELSDRIAVLHSGSVAGVVVPKETDRYEIGRLMLGGGGEH